ncbi:MAG: dihydrofolate reductase family protein [Leptolyngbyaceae cyanobacterium bins.302]|nr:dihydrofolate reductase family protein [Leptolyngbyaceae cyanobacterium bins.302]
MKPEFVLYIATSLDGYIARTDGSIDWLPDVDPEAEDYGYNEFYGAIDALVMGATTYEQVLTFGEWVYPGKQSYVLTQRSLSSDRPDITFVDGVEATVDQITQQGYQRIWVVGGGKVISALMQQSLITEFIITVFPLLLGSGIPLFQSVPEHSLKLIQAKPFASGAVELRYQLSPTGTTEKN